MRSLKHFALTAIMAGFIPHASAVDLSTWPTSLLGDKPTSKTAALAKGSVGCRMTGTLHMNGIQMPYTGHVMLTHDGIQDNDGFGHFTSASTKPSFVQYSVAFPNQDGSAGGFTCHQMLDTTSSKYAVNKNGVGVSELHWLADEDTTKTSAEICLGFVDQMGWIMDKTGARSVTTRINEAQTTAPFSAQNVDCFKSK